MTFRERLSGKSDFVITAEHVPPRGFTGKGIDRILEFAEQAAGSQQVHALSITDNAGGNPAYSADDLALDLKKGGVEPIVHFSCKDMNRNSLETRAYVLARQGLENLLVISGDYPVSGHMGRPKPVFDTDAVTALHHLRAMNTGIKVKIGKRESTLESTGFYMGAAVSPFKWTEGSSVMQYIKMEKKINAGAEYFISQLGYDAKKYVELYRYTREILKSDTALIGSVYLLSAGAARFINSGEVPGSFVSDRLLKEIRENSKGEDKGKGDKLKRAAKQVAILKGIGYNGAHIEGLNLKYNDVIEILEMADEMRNNWKDLIAEVDYEPDNGFYIFDGGEDPGFIGKEGEPRLRKTKRKAIVSFMFWLMRITHKLIFVKGTIGFKFIRLFMRFIQKHKTLYKIFEPVEYFFKKILFDCKNCADCALFDLFYLCPESKCPKGMRNGPCGGARVNGRCEVFENKYCIWEKAYRRAKNRKRLDNFRETILPRNWDLYKESSWINYYTDRDHSAHKIE